MKNAQATWTADQKVKSNCIQGWSQLGTWHVHKCQCEKGLSNQEDADNLVKIMNNIRTTIKNQYPSCGEIPPLVNSCKVVSGGSNSNGNSSGNNVNQPQVDLIYTGHESNSEKFRDEYIKSFSSASEFNAYASGMNVKRVGEAMAKDLSKNLKQIQGLVNTTDPVLLLNDFNQKITQIENLEANFNEQYNSYSFQTGQQLGNSIGNKDYESALFQGLGLLNAHLEKQEALRELERQKEALYRDRLTQMSKIYWKAVDYNNSLKEEYFKKAAYSNSLEEETYYLKYVENLDCHLRSMKSNFSVNNTYWLSNNCPTPSKYFGSDIKTDLNNHGFMSETAKRKFDLFLETNNEHFRTAAIHFGGVAASLKPSRLYFLQLAKYYKDLSAVSSLSNFIFAKSYDMSGLSQEDQQMMDLLIPKVEFQIKNALKEENMIFLDQFLKLGLDKVITINEMNILTYVISIDSPVNALRILDHVVKNLNPNQRKLTYQTAIQLAVSYDSEKVVKLLHEEGVSIDFILKGKHPIEIAEKSLSPNCYTFLMSVNKKKDIYKKTFKNSPINLVVLAGTEPMRAAAEIDKFDKKKVAEVIFKLVNDLTIVPEYFTALGNSVVYKAYFDQVPEVKERVVKYFLDELYSSKSRNNAHQFINSGVLAFDHCPLISELDQLKETHENQIVSKPLTIQEELKLIIDAIVKSRTLIENFPATEEGYTIEMRNETLRMQDESIKKYQDWLKKKSLSNEEIEEIDLMIFSTIGSDRSNTYSNSLKKGYYDYYMFKYGNTVISTKEKIDVIIEGIEKDMKQPHYMATVREAQKTTLENMKSWRSSKRLDDWVVRLVNTSYPHYALKMGKPLDALSIGFLIGGYESIQHERQFSNTDNLAFVAHQKNNIRLFKALDERYDLLTVTNGDGEPLLVSILSTGSMCNMNKYWEVSQPFFQLETEINSILNNPYLSNDEKATMKEEIVNTHEDYKNRTLLYSKDFDLNTQFEGVHVLSYFLKNVRKTGGNYPDENYMKELMELIKYYKIDVNQKMTEEGGTLYHWLIDQILNCNKELTVNCIREIVPILKELNIDKSIRDNNNLTAYEKFLQVKPQILNERFPFENKMQRTHKYLTKILR